MIPIAIPRPARIAALVLAAALLGGCVTFEHAPVAHYRCDPALAGRWQTVKTERLPRPIEVAADCRMRWPQDDGSTFETTLRSFRLDEVRYLAFTPQEADRLMDMKGDLVSRAPADSVLLVRYRIDGDEAKLWLADPQVLLTPDADGKTAARRVDDQLAHVEGGRRATAALLRARGDALFRATQEDGMTRFQREPAEAAP